MRQGEELKTRRECVREGGRETQLPFWQEREEARRAAGGQAGWLTLASGTGCVFQNLWFGLPSAGQSQGREVKPGSSGAAQVTQAVCFSPSSMLSHPSCVSV